LRRNKKVILLKMDEVHLETRASMLDQVAKHLEIACGYAFVGV
jgi:hypothetical protein